MIEAIENSRQKLEYPKYEKGETVALFIPCYVDQFYPSIGKATVELLENAGVPIEFPEEQTCCGQPAFNSGYWPDAQKVIDHFAKVFEKYRWIVTPSGSCAAMCRLFYEQSAPDSLGARVGKRVFEICEFLVNVLGITDTGASYPKKVTMHIGCHTRRELGIAAPAMQLLHSIRDLQYVELPNMEECCGFGGTFSVKMAGTSLAMGKKKIENIQKTGADVVATTDISCAMHFGGMMKLDPVMKDIPIVHITELLIRR
ncbi:MAG: (Fe-S)-binding protein [Thermoguttaceae bacterium]